MPSEWRTVSETDGCEPENRLDLAELDAVAEDLHLVVGATEENEVPVEAGRPGRRSAGAHAPRRRAGDEPLSSQGGRVQVPPGEPGASYVHLPGDADRHGPTERVEDVYLSVGDRASHRHDVAEVLLRIEAGRVGRHLRGAVEVDQPALRNALAEAAKELDGGSSRSTSSGGAAAGARRGLRPFRGAHGGARHENDPRHAVALERVDEPVGILRVLVRDDDEQHTARGGRRSPRRSRRSSRASFDNTPRPARTGTPPASTGSC